MTRSKEITEYYDATSSREIRDDLMLAVKLVDGPRVAIDCGCGAGSDIAFLRSKGFFVHAFDIELESIARCQMRFSDDRNVVLSRDTFSAYKYPRASLVVADASLFFCSEDEFSVAWCRIKESLLPRGIFVGSFLGPEDTMANPDFKKDVYWPEILVSSERQVRGWLDGFDLINFTEHRTTGESIGGNTHDWHIFSVVARKQALKGTEN